MLKKLLKLQLKELQIAFFAGSTLGCLFGCVAGVGVGVAVGALFAPKSGRELRDDIASKTAEIAEDVKQKSVRLKDQAGNICSNISDLAAANF